MDFQFCCGLRGQGAVWDESGYCGGSADARRQGFGRALPAGRGHDDAGGPNGDDLGGD